MWTEIKQELAEFSKAKYLDFDELSPLAFDSVMGALWELGHRTPLHEYINENGFFPLLQHIEKTLNLEKFMDMFQEKGTSPCEDKRKRKREIGIGTFGWTYNHSLIRKAISKGVFCIDTAPTYGYGRVEKELGEIEEVKKDVKIATKIPRNFMSYEAVLKSYARSFLNLGEPKDFYYQIHWPNPKFSLMETIMALDKLSQFGRMASFGVCNFPIYLLELTMKYLSSLKSKLKLETVQVKYNLLNRWPEESLIPYCEERGIKVISYSPFHQNFQELESPLLSHLANRVSCTRPQLILAWLMEKSIPIPRTNDMNHMVENLDSIYVKLGKGHIEEINSIFPQKRGKIVYNIAKRIPQKSGLIF